MEQRLIFQMASSGPSGSSSAPESAPESAPQKKEKVDKVDNAQDKIDLSQLASEVLVTETTDQDKEDAKDKALSFKSEEELMKYLEDVNAPIKERFLVMASYIKYVGPVVFKMDHGFVRLDNEGMEIDYDDGETVVKHKSPYDSPDSMKELVDSLKSSGKIDVSKLKDKADSQTSSPETEVSEQTGDKKLDSKKDTIFGFPKKGKDFLDPKNVPNNEWGQYYKEFYLETEELKKSGAADPVELGMRQFMLFIMAFGAYAGEMGVYFSMMSGDYEKVIEDSKFKDEKMSAADADLLTGGINNGFVLEDYSGLSTTEASIKFISKTYFPFETTDHIQLAARLKNPSDNSESLYTFKQKDRALEIKDATYIPEGTIIFFSLGGVSGDIVAARSTGQGKMFEYFVGGDMKAAKQFELLGANCPFKTASSIKTVFYPKFITNIENLNDDQLNIEEFYKTVDINIDKSPIGKTLKGLEIASKNSDLMHSFESIKFQTDIGVAQKTLELLSEKISGVVGSFSVVEACMKQVEEANKLKLHADLLAKGKAVFEKFVQEFYKLVAEYEKYLQAQTDATKKQALGGLKEQLEQDEAQVKKIVEFYGIVLPKVEEKVEEQKKTEVKEEPTKSSD